MSIRDIQEAIRAELEETPRYYDFRVQSAQKDGELWRIVIDPSAVFSEGSRVNVVLDDFFEGAAAWWAGPPKGTGDVLAVIAEDEQLILRYATAPPPKVSGLLRLYPPRYLDALLALWNHPQRAKVAYETHVKIRQPRVQPEITPLATQAFPWLRERQAAAFALHTFTDSFLWGPPGTGKTTTLGALLAQYLTEQPQANVLLLSTTNHAVDQALIAVDQALEKCRAEKLRKQIFRIGNHFVASHYKNREHLIPVIDRSLIRKLYQAEAERPDSANIHVYHVWKQQVDALRQAVREQARRILDQARVAAMTTTRAVFDMENLWDRPTYDLVVFDEASQVGLAHALALAPLGKTRLFAGDPKQLSPIVKSKRAEAQEWLGRSPFNLMTPKAANTCLLNEQSRMAEPICQIVSHVFYNGDLIVAKACADDPQWLISRRIPLLGDHADEPHVVIQSIEHEGTWSQRYKGPIRYASAQATTELIKAAVASRRLAEQQIICLTPFRAQRALLRSMMIREGLRVKVSTVHRAQGSESPVVIFDPVQAANAFLQGEEARRLINVALSRAQGKLVLLLSAGDCQNPLFKAIFNIVWLSRTPQTATDICDYYRQPHFPHCALGKTVRIKSNVGKVTEILDGGARFILLNAQTGKEQTFIVSYLSHLCGERTNPSALEEKSDEAPSAITKASEKERTSPVKPVPVPPREASAPLLAERYRVYGDGTATDNRTGLRWMRFSLGQVWKGDHCVGHAQQFTWEEALKAARTLNRQGGYAGYRDWRVPKREELLTLVYCSSGLPKVWNDTGDPCEGDYQRPTIHSTTFPNTPDNWYWTASTAANPPDSAWLVLFTYGCARIYPKALNLRVRLARGGSSGSV
ncbi:MAG: DUF1566 domain-containing protein [Candidatus Competibacteraceae bacterium]|nr:DUF1566 domain-containing protein [Candidatus Competibacteraceae bacterium]